MILFLGRGGIGGVPLDPHFTVVFAVVEALATIWQKLFEGESLSQSLCKNMYIMLAVTRAIIKLSVNILRIPMNNVLWPSDMTLFQFALMFFSCSRPMIHQTGRLKKQYIVATISRHLSNGESYININQVASKQGMLHVSACHMARPTLWSRSGPSCPSTWALQWHLWMKRCSLSWQRFLLSWKVPLAYFGMSWRVL